MGTLSSVLDFLSQFADFLVAAGEFALGIFESVIDILADIPELVLILGTYFNMLPGPFLVFGHIILYYSIIIILVKIVNLVVPFF